MSLLNTASVWNNQNNNSNSRKRTPQLKRVSNNTAKVRPYDRENFTTNDFSELSEFTSIPLDLISSISSSKAQGSITTPFPIIDILFFLTIPDGNNLNLYVTPSITKV